MIKSYFDRLPFVAILRGIVPAEAASIARVLAKAGFSIIEVPMNSPEPLKSIRRMHEELGNDTLLGAGTVLSAAWIPQIAEAGGRIIVMPHADTEVIRAAKSSGLYCTPGIATPTEGFAALAAGADALKLFPAELLTPRILKAFKAVFAKDTLFIPVGGITPEMISPYHAAGAGGFGLGAALFKPGMSADEVAQRAQTYVETWRRVSQDQLAN